MAEGHTVEGRQFRTKADYEAALRDKKKIDAIKAKMDLNSPKDVLALYEQMQGGTYRFESMVGNDFDDYIYELAEKLKQQGVGEAGKTGKAKKGMAAKRAGGGGLQAKGGKASPGRSRAAGTKNKNGPDGGKISLKDFDEDMQKEIAAQIKARDRRRKWLVTLCSIGAVLGFGYFFIYYYAAGRTDARYEELASLKNSEILAEPVNKEEEKKVIVVRGEQEEIVLPDILDDYKTLYNKNKKLI